MLAGLSVLVRRPLREFEFHVPTSGVPIFQAAVANLNPFSETNATSHAAYQKHLKNPGVTEFVESPDRGHSLTIDHGWHEVAQAAWTSPDGSCPQGRDRPRIHRWPC